MGLKPSPWKWALFFAALGLAVPSVLTIRYLYFGESFGDLPYLLWLWPSSIMFMALDGPGPAPIWTVVYVYSIAFVENCIIYTTIGMFLWSIAFFALRRSGKRNDSSEPPE